MAHFTEAEIAYLQSQKLGRMATVAEDGAPNNVPVTFRYNAALDTIDIRGFNLNTSKKFRNIQRDARVSFVVDDVLPPWEARAVEIRGTAEAIEPAADAGENDSGMIRIHPAKIISWGIDSQPYQRNSRKVNA